MKINIWKVLALTGKIILFLVYGLETDCTEDSKVTKEARDKTDQTRSSSSVGSEGRERGCVWVQRVAALMGT